MDVAYSANYRLITAREAIKGRKYFCIVCNNDVIFCHGEKRIPYFKHTHNNPGEIDCEFYSKSVSANSIYEDEFSARQKIRLAIERLDDEYQFKLIFPLIKSQYLKNQLKNSYFSYRCKEVDDFDLNVVHLLPSRKRNDVIVPLLDSYSISSTNDRFEKYWGLNNSGKYNPFEDGAIIFKEIHGQHISIPYRNILLSGKFFIVSKKKLQSIHEDLEVINITAMSSFHIYELIMPVSFNDDLQRWFTVYLNYTLQSATCHLDIISPLDFKKIGTTIYLTTSHSTWQLTNIGERFLNQRLIIVDSKNHRQMLQVSDEQLIELNLNEGSDYEMYLDQEVSEIYTIRQLPEIEYKQISIGNIFVNGENILFHKQQLEAAQVNINSELDLLIHSDFEMHYRLGTSLSRELLTRTRIDVPRVWSLEITNYKFGSVDSVVEQIFHVYERQHLYQKIIVDVKYVSQLLELVSTSKFQYKDKLLFLIRKMGVRVPREIPKIMK